MKVTLLTVGGLAAALSLAGCTEADRLAWLKERGLWEPIDYAGQAMVGAIGNTLENTNIYSDTVRTPSGTYDITGTCVYSSCDSNITKRK